MQKMLNKILLFTFSSFLFLPATTFALNTARPLIPETVYKDDPQRPHHKRRGKFNPKEYFRKMEIFITQEAGLTQDEAKAFFPVFRDTKKKQRQMSRRIHEKMRSINKQPLSERQYDRLLGEIQELHLQEAKLQNESLKKWRKILPASKVLKVLKAENEFCRKTFREMTD